MPLQWFICPDKELSTVEGCLDACRMDSRCFTLPYLKFISREREWTGVPSTTQLLNGTMYEFLKLTQPYMIDPDSRVFATHGSLSHKAMDVIAKELNLPSEIPLSIDRDVFDLLEPDTDGWLLSDYKTWGSYRVAKALGLVEVGKMPDPSGDVYKTTGKWGKAGSPKMVSVFQPMPQEADMEETELQLNRYRIMLELLGLKITKMQVQVFVRDGGLAVASSRGITRNGYRIPVDRLDDSYVKGYFVQKQTQLLNALELGQWTEPCNDRESWKGARCNGYCEVWVHCPKGLLLHMEAK